MKVARDREDEYRDRLELQEIINAEKNNTKGPLIFASALAIIAICMLILGKSNTMAIVAVSAIAVAMIITLKSFAKQQAEEQAKKERNAKIQRDKEKALTLVKLLQKGDAIRFYDSQDYLIVTDVTDLDIEYHSTHISPICKKRRKEEFAKRYYSNIIEFFEQNSRALYQRVLESVKREQLMSKGKD